MLFDFHQSLPQEPIRAAALVYPNKQKRLPNAGRREIDERCF